MKPVARLRFFSAVAAVAVAACGSTPAKTDPAQPPNLPNLPPNDNLVVKKTVQIAVAAVTLGEDCQRLDPQIAAVPAASSVVPASPVASKPKPPATAGQRRPLRPEDVLSPAGDGVHDYLSLQSNSGESYCEQTAMQLQITSTGAATSIALRNVELLDDKGQVLGTLIARLPTRWDDATSQYSAWDLSVAAGASLKVSWVLSTPVWSNLGMTRAEAANRIFRVRVTIGAAGGDHVLDGQARVVVVSPPTPLPAGVVT